MSEAKNYTSSTLESMTINDLVAHALAEFEVVIDPKTMVKQKIVGYLLALQDVREVGMDSKAGPALPPETDNTEVTLLPGDSAAEADEVMRQSKETRVRIIFHSTPEPGGNMQIKMGLNGRAYVVKRDTEVSLPESVFNACIRDAVQTLYEPVKDPETGITTVSQPREVARFSYTILGIIPGRKAA